MLVKILIGVAALIFVFLIVVATRPDEFHIERSIAISAPPERSFATVNDFHTWGEWSPWEKMDPGMHKTFAGSPAGAGAVYSWVGNDKVGEGRMTIEKSEAPSRVEIKLEFLKPWTATDKATFTFEPAAGGSKVTWAMDGKSAFVVKAASLFVNMDKMIGADFEKGLASLKSIAEAPPKAAPASAQ